MKYYVILIKILYLLYNLLLDRNNSSIALLIRERDPLRGRATTRFKESLIINGRLSRLTRIDGIPRYYNITVKI